MTIPWKSGWRYENTLRRVTNVMAKTIHLDNTPSLFLSDDYTNQAKPSVRVRRLVRPPQQRRTDSESRPHRRQQHQASLLQLAFFDSGVHRQRYGSRRGIAIPVDVHD